MKAEKKKKKKDHQIQKLAKLVALGDSSCHTFGKPFKWKELFRTSLQDSIHTQELQNEIPNRSVAQLSMNNVTADFIEAQLRAFARPETSRTNYARQVLIKTMQAHWDAKTMLHIFAAS